MKPEKTASNPNNFANNLDSAPQMPLVTSVSLMADCLVSPLSSAAMNDHSAQSEIIKRALNAAYEAESRLAEQQKRISQLELASVTDELTGLLNRRGFLAQIKNALTAATRYKEEGVLIYVDLDEFKSINDAYGHAAGDEVLKRVALILRGNLRDSDSLGRLGGDEFAILLTRSSWEDGWRRAKRIEKALNNAYASWNGLMLAIKASFGVEAYSPMDNIEAMFARADDAMYKTKRQRTANDDGQTISMSKKNAKQNGRAWSWAAA